MKKTYIILTLVLSLVVLTSCNKNYSYDEDKINIITTTNIISDLATEIGRDKVNVYHLINAGVDPHGYIPRPSDYTALSQSDIILTNGLNLEAKMITVFESYRDSKPVIAIGNELLHTELSNRIIENNEFGGNYDPHFWFDIPLYKEAAKIIYEVLVDYDPDNQTYYKDNLENYLIRLDNLYQEAIELVEKLELSRRVLITAHDAFSYLARLYEFEVYSLQGLSTANEISPSDIKAISQIVIDKNVPAIFPETSVSPETIKALKEAVYNESKLTITIGDNLYSDSLGSTDFNNTYLKMYLENIKTITEALGGSKNAWLY